MSEWNKLFIRVVLFKELGMMYELVVYTLNWRYLFIYWTRGNGGLFSSTFSVKFVTDKTFPFFAELGKETGN